jgi:hypothetical protein
VVVVRVAPRAITREVLLSLPILALNVTFEAPASAVRWIVSAVAVSGEPVQYVGDSTNVDPWVVIVFEAPAAGWVEPETPLLTSTTIDVTITLSCDGGAVVTVMLAIPAPGLSRLYAERVEVAARVAQIASFIAGGGPSGAALGRVMATRSMVMCDADTAIGGGVLDLGLRTCSTGTPGTIAARSAIVSNIILIFVVTVVLIVLAAIWSIACSTTLREAAYTLCLPSSLLPVWTAVLPSSGASATLLVARIGASECATGDALLGLCGIVIAVVPTSALLWLWCKSSRWICAKEVTSGSAPMLAGDGVENNQRFLRALWNQLRRVMRRQWRWTSSASGEPSMMGPAWVVMLEYRVVWFAALDAATLVAVGCIKVVSGLSGSQAACRGWTISAISLLIAQTVLLLVIRPHTTLFSLVYYAVTLVLTCLSVTAQLLFVLLSSTSTSGLWLLQAAAVCDLTVVGITATRLIVDVIQLTKAVRRRTNVLKLLLQRRRSVLRGNEKRSCADDGAPLEDVHFLSDSNSNNKKNSFAPFTALLPLKELQMPFVDDSLSSLADVADDDRTEMLLSDDSHFWDASGAARVASKKEELFLILAPLAEGRDNDVGNVL